MFLGLDLSTQRLKATIIDGQGAKIVLEENVHFDSELPSYQTRDGVHVVDNDQSVTTPTLLWVEAIDLLLKKIAKQSPSLLFKVRGVGASGQQHGSIYFRSLPTLNESNENKDLHHLFKDSFTISDSPIWMDMSTGQECRRLETAVVSSQNLAALTGSSAYERFTGAQIAKVVRTKPKEYAETSRIALVSSFVPTLFLLSSFAPIDPSDGSGMNLLNIKTKTWVSELLAECDPSLQLAEKLGCIGGENEVLGKIHPYFVKKYGFNPDCLISTGSGDNPCTLSSMPCSKPGDLIISFGTSDTCMFVVDKATPMAKSGHIFCNPNHPDSFMGLLCFRNGSLARERIRDRYGEGKWDTFNEKASKASDQTYIGIFFPDPEIQPANAQGVRYFVQKSDGSYDQVQEETVFERDHGASFSPCKAIIDSQNLLKQYYCNKLGLHPTRIIVVGGGAQNKVMVQSVANVFAVDVYSNNGSNSASLGACYRAMFAVDYKIGSFQEMLEKIHPGLDLVARPDAVAHAQYKSLGFGRLMDDFYK